MYIYRIVIDNFKSFAHKTVIPFEQGFTTISGPNGSGKSNIIDSILFCLGLSTSRTMRAESLGDLINNLSKRQEAMVTITFRKTPEDMEKEAAEGAQAKLDVGRVQEAFDEDGPDADIDLATGEFVQVGRRIRKGSQGYNSSYYLNGRATTLTGIHDYLGQFHISPGMYNVMMQGDVQGIVKMSPMDRRKIIDEIAGVAEFDRKIEQAQKELEATGANIERNTILLSEIEVRLEQLSTERDHALKYKQLRDEKHRYEAMLLSARYLDLKKAIEAAVNNMAEARKKKTAAEEELKALSGQIGVTRNELLRLSEEVKKKGEDQQIALKKQIESLKGHIARKEDVIRFNTDKIEENKQRIAQMQADIQRQRENMEAIDEEIKGFRYQLKELQGFYKKEAGEYEALNKQFDALTGSGSELSVKRNEIRSGLLAEEDALSGLNRRQLDIEAEIKRHRYEMDLRLREENEYSEKSAQLVERRDALCGEVNELDLEKSAFEAQIKKIQAGYAETRVALNKTLERYTGAHRQYVQLEAKKRAYDEVNFSRAVEAVLDSDLDGIHGTLAQLGTVEKDFAVAMEIAMGGRVQNIVVDDDEVAKDGIHYLKETRSGRATFLPLNKIQPARRLPALPRHSGVIDYAVNLMSFDPLYQDVFAYALGDTLIVEDLESARPLLRKHRMVTVDGDLLEKSGAMTGGARKQQTAGFFAGAGLEEELEKLYNDAARHEEKKAELEKKLTSIELKMEGVKEDYGQCLNRVSARSAELASLENQLAELRQAASGSVDVSDLEQRIAGLEKERETVEAEMETRQAAVDRLAKELDGIESQLPADQIETLRRQMQEVKFQMDYYDAQIRNIQTEIKSKEMEKDYQKVGIGDCDTRIKEAGENSKTLAREQDECREEIALTRQQITELDAQTTELDEELKKLQDERDAVQVKLIEEEKQKNIKEREIEQLDEQVLSFQSRKRELEPQLAEVREELAASDIDPETIRAEDLPSEEEVNKNIARLTKKMETMEPVNMLAIDEYDKVNERRNELAEKIATLESETEAINVRINGYHELKLSAFMKAYESVDNHFKSIFAELSDGNGHLALTNPDDPFAGGLAIYAQPRGKKVQRIEAMSGGEKSLTSLAFVFSLQRYMPAPFYALDEVDMNLDGINAEKLAVMLKRETETAQFVVVSLRKPMLEHSDRTIGVTQRKNGITKVTGIKHRDDDQQLIPDELNDEGKAVAAAS